MSCQSIIRQAVAFRNELKIGLAGLEKHLDLPAFPINPNALFFGKIRVCANKGNPVLFVLFVTDIDDLRWDFFFFPDYDIYR